MYLYFCASSLNKAGGASNSDFYVNFPVNTLRGIKSVAVLKVTVPNKNSVTSEPFLILALNDTFNSASIDGTYTTIIDTQLHVAGQSFITTEPGYTFDIPPGSTDILTRVHVKIMDSQRNTFLFTPVSNDKSDNVSVFLRFEVQG